MTRGKFYLFVPGFIYRSPEFNGDMYYSGYGRDAAEGMKHVASVNSFVKFVKKFNDMNFHYPEYEAGVSVCAEGDAAIAEYMDMGDYFSRHNSDYLFIKNESGKTLIFMTKDTRQCITLKNHGLGVLYFGEVAHDFDEELNMFYTPDAWMEEWKQNIRTADDLRAVLPLPKEEYKRIKAESDMYPMSISRYYASLINPEDPDDPIRKMAVPAGVTLDGLLDTSGEKSNTVVPGVQHKYKQTTLALISEACAMYCRYCFRKRFVGKDATELAKLADLMDYLLEHPYVNNVLLSGGDALMMRTEELAVWLEALVSLDQLDFVRIGSRTPVTFPARINSDPVLLDILTTMAKRKQIYLVTHFNHPREFSEESMAAVKKLQSAGVIVKNQTVLLKGVNDDPEVLGELLRLVTRNGIIQHYIFQCRPVVGALNYFQVPIREGSRIVNAANAMQNGLGKCADYTMSHVTGKIRILGETEEGMVFQYKQAKSNLDIGRIFTKKLDDNDTWLPD